MNEILEYHEMSEYDRTLLIDNIYHVFYWLDIHYFFRDNQRAKFDKLIGLYREIRGGSIFEQFWILNSNQTALHTYSWNMHPLNRSCHCHVH